ncbi:nucleotidyltransferase domain-containing protein [Reyranella massiliensis]|uniref:nucleotidyltransferase domain-containing protein n=1 Tax=Reyranella massiliensis TaxID=445220 RepID=UPI0009FE8B14
MSQPSPDLVDLTRVVAAWAAARAVKIYIFGSRVRGDHGPLSDVDLYIDLSEAHKDNETVHWWTRQQETSFADLTPYLPGPLGKNGHETLDPQDLVMVSRITSGKAIWAYCNVICIWLPPKPTRTNLSHAR